MAAQRQPSSPYRGHTKKVLRLSLAMTFGDNLLRNSENQAPPLYIQSGNERVF